MPGSAQPPEQHVTTDTFSQAQAETLTCRLALNTLRSMLPTFAETEEISVLLGDLHDRLARVEEEALRDSGFAWQYLIIKPISHASPPPPDDMAKITGAVRTLADLGMIINETL